MKLIKAAITYKATIPSDTAILAAHLAEKPFTECMEMDLRSVGFVAPTEDAYSLVQTFPGGLAFRVRIDEKIIPSGTVKAEVEKHVKAIKESTGRKVGKKERAEIKDAVMVDLCRRALVKTKASITCFYEIATGYLIVPTASKSIADVCTSLLVQAVGSVKTETINVSEVKHGLTTRLQKWLADDDQAQALAVPPGAALLHLRVLGVGAGQALHVSERYFPLPRFAQLADGVQASGSITQAFAQHGVTDYVRQESRISARLPDPDVAGLLGQPASRPVLLVSSVNVDPQGVPIEYARAWFAGDRVTLTVSHDEL